MKILGDSKITIREALPDTVCIIRIRLDMISLWAAQTSNFVRWIKKQLYNNKFFRIYNELPRYSEKNNQIKFLREIPNKVFNIHLSFAKLKMSKVKALEISNKLNCVLWRNYCYLGFDCSLSKLKICMYNLPSNVRMHFQ